MSLVLDYHEIQPEPGTVFTNGCFDVLHLGHVDLLWAARKQCAAKRLIVAVNSDRSVRALKGDSRPIYSLRERMALLDGLKAVDIVTCFDTDTVTDCLIHIRPAWWVKGGDYTMDSLNKLEVQAAREVGAAIVIIEKFGDYSTTGVINKLKG